jgi:ribonuclease E
MTRKKLGLGLLETFSEPCEVCAGRGVIVHHDPVTKHRPQVQTAQPAQDGGGRRNRSRGGGGGATSTTVKNGVGSSGTHAITEDVRNALARVAASTVLHTTEIPVIAEQAASAEATEAAVEILDIPVTKATRQQRRISTHDAEQILDSVLEALPEPKQPGQGRSRVSRRAGSSGQVVSAPTND